MSQREMTMHWIKDILEQLSDQQRRLEWAEDRESIRYLTETMIRDLERCERLCRSLHDRTAPRPVAS